MPGDGILFYGTTGPSGTVNGDSQPDRSQWLGRFRAAETLHDTLGTVTTAQSATTRHLLIDSARIGDGPGAHAGKWLAMQTGSAALAAARVEMFDDATGLYVLDRPLSASAGLGDAYALFPPRNVFPDVTAEESREGNERYRCIVLRNTSGVSIDARIFFAPLGFAPVLARTHPDARVFPVLQRDDDITDIYTEVGAIDPAGGPDNFSATAGPWLTPLSASAADVVIGSATLQNGFEVAIWLRRRIEPGAVERRSVAVQIVALSTVSGSDPDPLAGTAILAWDFLGDAPTLSLEADRFVSIGGGARLRARALAASGLPAVGRDVFFRVPLGDPSTIAADDDPLPGYTTTDRRGDAGATLRATEDRALVGATTRPRVGFVASEEVLGVQPLALGTVDVEAGAEVLAEGNTPDLLEEYLTDPAPAFLGGTA